MIVTVGEKVTVTWSAQNVPNTKADSTRECFEYKAVESSLVYLAQEEDWKQGTDLPDGDKTSKAH